MHKESELHIPKRTNFLRNMCACPHNNNFLENIMKFSTRFLFIYLYKYHEIIETWTHNHLLLTKWAPIGPIGGFLNLS